MDIRKFSPIRSVFYNINTLRIIFKKINVLGDQISLINTFDLR